MRDSDRDFEIWARIVEPGDEAAGYLVESLGPTDAIRLVRDGSAARILAELNRAGATEAGIARFNRLDQTLEESLARWIPRLGAAERLAGLRQSNGYAYEVLTRRDAEWPSQLNDLGWAEPFAIWYRGAISVLAETRNWVALVGARASSPYGAQVVAELTRGLADSRIGVVSGGAYGIDSLAHSEALMHQVSTIAVMAGGVDRPYPLGNRPLLERVAELGILLSEMPPGTAPTKWRFLQRNRLIAAIADCTIVVEAGWRSGSINTANHAEQLSRPVGAVPGSVLEMSSAGCNRLIARQQAQLVSDSADILEMIGARAGAPFDVGHSDFVDQSRGPLETRALDALAATSRSLERVARDAGLTVHETELALANLQLEGSAEESNGLWRRLVSSL